MECPLCKGKEGVNVTSFDNPSHHLVITIKDGDTHVHGPFKKELVIREMIKSLIAEAEKYGIVYRPSTDERVGD